MTTLLRSPRADPPYARPSSVAEAVALLTAQPGARPLAGGTDLMNELRLGVARPPLVVDIDGLAELRGVQERDDEVVIGAGVTMRALRGHPVLARLGALADAARLLGGPQVQAAATLGGNLCTASPAAETATPLLVHAATAVLAGPDGAREVPLDAFWTGPRRTVLAPGELLVALRLEPDAHPTAAPSPAHPTAAPSPRSAYRRLQLRRSVDIAVVSASARLQVTDGAVTGARIAVGAVAPTPLLVAGADEPLLGLPVGDPGRAAEPATARGVVEAARRCAAAATPIDDVRASARYRSGVLDEVVRRAVLAALGAEERAVLDPAPP